MIESMIELEMGKAGWKVIHILIEIMSKSKMSESKLEKIDEKIEFCLEDQMGERTWKG